MASTQFVGLLMIIAALVGVSDGALTDAAAATEATTARHTRTFLIEMWGKTTEIALTQGKQNFLNFNATCSAQFGNDTACPHDGPKGVCCESGGKVQCEKNANGESYDNAGMYFCASECYGFNQDHGTFDQTIPAFCSDTEQSIVAHAAGVKAGTKARDDGWVSICSADPMKCMTCEGYQDEAKTASDCATKTVCKNANSTNPWSAPNSQNDCLEQGWCLGPSPSPTPRTTPCSGTFVNNTWEQLTESDFVEVTSATSESACEAVGSGAKWTYPPGLGAYNTFPMKNTTECNEHTPPVMTFQPNDDSLMKHIIPEGKLVKDAQLLADLAAGRTAEQAYTANPTYYGDLGRWGGHLANVVLASKATSATAVSVDMSIATGGVAFFVMPQVAAKMQTVDCTPDCGKAGQTNLTTADQHIIVLDVATVATSGSLVQLAVGKVTVVGGTSAGDIEISTDKRVRVSELANSGSVTFTNSADIFLTDLVNSGNVSFTGVTSGLYNIISTGPLVIDNTNVQIWHASNGAGGTIAVSGSSTFYVRNSSNAGSITISGGTVDIVVDCADGGNTGTITLGAGVTGSLTVGDACKGTITDNSSGGVTVTLLTADSPTVTTATPSTIGSGAASAPSVVLGLALAMFSGARC